ncbi:histidine phosphatase superfamily [Syncephalis fuscata]|nr:histidine phosphatase superfamily [Syncephalis fuscata]
MSDNVLISDAVTASVSTDTINRLKDIVTFNSNLDTIESANEDDSFLEQHRDKKRSKKLVYKIRRECCILLILTSIIGVLIFATLFIQWLFGHSNGIQEKRHHSVPIRNLMALLAPYDSSISSTQFKANNNTCNVNSADAAAIPGRCNLVHFQAVVRHGDRNPIPKRVEQLTAFEKELQSNKNPNWPKWLQEWRSPYNQDNADQLMEQGVLQLQQLAQRDVCRYGKWLNEKVNLLSEKAAEVRHQQAWYSSSSTQRAIDSANAYASVFSGKALPQSAMHIIPLKQDRELSVGGGCQNWFYSESNVTAKLEFLRPYTAHYLSEIRDLLSTRMGFQITALTLDLMGELCAFDYIKEDRRDHWCELATDASNEQFPVKNPSPLEYYDFITDRKHYHRCGALHPINKRVSCKLFTQIVNEMQQAIYGNLPLRWRLRFGHGNTILLLLTHLNLYTEPPTFDQNRGFRTSHISPFAANIHFELLKCTGDNDSDNDGQDYFVRMLHNEHPIQIPGCPEDSILCPWKEFYKVAQMRIGHCDMNEICGPE